MLKKREIVGAPILGALAAIGGFAPQALSFCVPLALGLLVWRLTRLRKGVHGFLLAGLAAWGFFGAGVSWLHHALHHIAGMPAPLSALCIGLLAGYMAFYPALAGLVFVRFHALPSVLRVLLFAAVWTLGELLRGWVFTGFPWLSIAYSQIETLKGFFPIIGAYGVGFVLAMSAAAFAFCLRPGKALTQRLVLLGLASSFWVVGWSLPTSWTHPVGPPTTVALVQTNVPQSLKWQPEFMGQWLADNVRWATENADAQLTVFPESALPLLAEFLPDGYLADLAAPAQKAGHDVLIGVLVRDPPDQAGHRPIFNAALSLGQHAGQRYAKNHLVPFGEYSPPLFSGFYRWANIPMSDQTPGGAAQPPLNLGGQRVAVNICYEDAFGTELRHALPTATVMLNLSNLAWYGHSAAQPQHLQMAQARALEAGRPMLRATNTGMTAYIAPTGEVISQLAAFTPGVLRVAVQGYEGLTPFARWGDAPVWWGAGLVLLLSLIFQKKS